MFGWCVRGPLFQTAGHSALPSLNFIQNQESRADLNDMVHRLWSIESFGVLPDVQLSVGKDDTRAVKLLEEKVRYRNGRYEALLLWATDHPDMPNNYAVALTRFQTLDRSLKKNPVNAKAYEATTEDYISQNHEKKLVEEELEDQVGRT